MSIWFEVAELHILILSSNLQIFYLKNCTDLLQCWRSPRIGPYISFINGGLLSKAEETAIEPVLEGVSHLPFGRQQGASVYILECFIVITICGILPMIVLDIVVFFAG
jgi:hypothetical protein